MYRYLVCTVVKDVIDAQLLENRCYMLREIIEIMIPDIRDCIWEGKLRELEQQFALDVKDGKFSGIKRTSNYGIHPLFQYIG